MAVGLAVSAVGATGASTADNAAFTPTDLDVRVYLRMNDWTPGGFGAFFVTHYAAPSNIGWAAGVSNAGNPSVQWTANGSTTLGNTGASTTGFTDGTWHWLRCVLDTNNGASGRTGIYYTLVDGVWSQIGTQTTAGTTSFFNSTDRLRVSATLPFGGKVGRVILLDGINGTEVANPNFMIQRVGVTSFTDDAGNVWTIDDGTIADDTANDSNSEALQALAQANFGLDLNGALREASGLDLDKNGIAQTLWGCEFAAAHDQAYALLGGEF